MLIAVVLLIVGINGFSVNTKGRVVKLLQSSYGSASWIEDFFADASYGNLSVGEVFTQEVHEKLNTKMSDLVSLQVALTRIKPSSLPKGAQQTFTVLQSRLDERTPHYQESIAIYNQLYAAYEDGSPTNITDLLMDSNYYVAVVADRFYNFLVNQANLWTQIQDNSCIDSKEDSCSHITERYFENTFSLASSDVTISAIFTAYYDGSYAEDNRFAPCIDILLKELK